MCKHDVVYRIENEQYGGVGCPVCKYEARMRDKAIASGRCPDCGRDLTADIREYSPLDLCAACAEEYDNALADIPFDGALDIDTLCAEFFSVAAQDADSAGYGG